MRTSYQILTDVYNIANTAIKPLISGEIYKNIIPYTDSLENCVVSLISGQIDKFIQDGALYVKIFYNDILQGSVYYDDIVRGGELEAILYSFSDQLKTLNGYSFEYDKREIYTDEFHDKHQHYAILKMNFKLTN